MITRRRLLLPVLLLVAISLAACDRLSVSSPDAGVNFGDPDVGGGAGQDTGPQTPIPTATATNEVSPRLDAAARATVESRPPTATPPVPTPTLPPTAEPSAAEPTAIPATPEPTPAPPTAEPTAAEPTATTEGANAAGEIIHTVQAGENLYRIGLQYGLSWVVIAEYNGIVDPNSITVGQELRIPPQTQTPTPETESSSGGQPESTAGGSTGDSDQAAGAPAAGSSPAVVTVAPGDTLYLIAQRHGIGWEQVAEANGLTSPNQIYAGQVLKIPTDVPGPTQEFTHQVHRGETLTGIARQYGLTTAELAEVNGLGPPYVIYPGQVLAIPGE